MYWVCINLRPSSSLIALHHRRWEGGRQGSVYVYSQQPRVISNEYFSLELNFLGEKIFFNCRINFPSFSPVLSSPLTSPLPPVLRLFPSCLPSPLPVTARLRNYQFPRRSLPLLPPHNKMAFPPPPASPPLYNLPVFIKSSCISSAGTQTLPPL